MCKITYETDRLMMWIHCEDCNYHLAWYGGWPREFLAEHNKPEGQRVELCHHEKTVIAKEKGYRDAYYFQENNFAELDCVCSECSVNYEIGQNAAMLQLIAEGQA